MKVVSHRGGLVSDESGNVLIIGALSMAALLGFMAFAVDMGVMFHAKRTAQSAADAGAIAAAQAKHYGLDPTGAGRADAARNGFNHGSNGVSVQVATPPIDGSLAGNSNYVEVIVSAPEPSYFGRVMGINSMTVTARAVAATEVGDQCAMALSGSAKSGLTVNGTSTTVYMPGCTVSVNSSGPQSVSSNGNGTLQAAAISTVGGTQGVKLTSTTVTPPATGSAPVSDPLAGSISPPTYSAASCLNDPKAAGTMTIGPASGGTICYKGLTINGGANVTLNPGIYVITGAFKLTGSSNLTGVGVTIYLAPGASLSINGSGTLDLEAPTSGPYNGILFYQDPSNTSVATLNGGSDTTIKGIVYMPTADLTFGGGNASSIYASLIAGTLTFSGGTQVNDYAKINSGTPLWKLQLAE